MVGSNCIVRFPEFKDDWEHKELNELLSESKKKNADLKYSKEEVLSVSCIFLPITDTDSWPFRTVIPADSGHFPGSKNKVPVRYHIKIKSNANPYLPEFDKYFFQRQKWREDLAKECKQITTFVEKEINFNSRVSLRRESLKSAWVHQLADESRTYGS